MSKQSCVYLRSGEPEGWRGIQVPSVQQTSCHPQQVAVLSRSASVPPCTHTDHVAGEAEPNSSTELISAVGGKIKWSRFFFNVSASLRG